MNPTVSSFYQATDVLIRTDEMLRELAALRCETAAMILEAKRLQRNQSLMLTENQSTIHKIVSQARVGEKDPERGGEDEEMKE